jgi:uncharacterized protein (TIGR03790 family)
MDVPDQSMKQINLFAVFYDVALSAAALCVAVFAASRAWLRLCRLPALLAIAISFNSYAAEAIRPQILLNDDPGFGAAQLAVIVNDADPQSVEIAEYYRQARNIPERNIIHVRIESRDSVMSPGEFAVIKKLIDRRLSDSIQAFALTWTSPYRVGCMSITSAFALGYDYRYCATGCRTTKTSDYFASNSRKPWQDHRIRPTMMLAGETVQDVKALIDRGVRADGSFPQGSAYLLDTSDRIRSVRRMFYPLIDEHLANRLPVNIWQSDSVKNKNDVMFYFTGLVSVPDLKSNFYLPGAVADHLTSYGGKLTDSSQMSSLRWLEAGLTGSYGTVVEPCAFPNKFPNPLMMMERYLDGERLIEAYWKSVDMPGQGIFIGEPLARPWYGYQLRKENNVWHLYVPLLKPGYYTIEGAYSDKGPFTPIARGLALSPVGREFVLAEEKYPVWRIVADL